MDMFGNNKVIAAGFYWSLGAVSSAMVFLSISDDTRFDDRITDAFPNTSFDRIYVDEKTDLTVAETGTTVLYFTRDHRYALVGNILDLENKVDLTTRRKEELQAASALEAKAFGKVAPASSPAASDSAPAPAARRAPSARIESVDLPETNFVVHNPGGSKVVYVVSDYNCSFCRRLHQAMEGLDVEIREIPVGFLGADSRIKASAALCADDPGAHAKGYFDGTAGTRISTCTTGDEAVAANTAWANQNGITGTPFLIMEDGRTNSGFRDQSALKAFLGLTS